MFLSVSGLQGGISVWKPHGLQGGLDARLWPSHERWDCGLVLRGWFSAEKIGYINPLLESVWERGVLYSLLQNEICKTLEP